jgi:hypothetical protein
VEGDKAVAVQMAARVAEGPQVLQMAVLVRHPKGMLAVAVT